MRVGLVIATVGAVIDVGYHFASGVPGMGNSSTALTGHLVTLLGMVVTMLGLIGAALKRRPARAKTVSKGESR
jgi:hypothetical protein